MLRDKLRVFVSRTLSPSICFRRKEETQNLFFDSDYILGFYDWLLRFKRRRNDVYFLLFSQHHCRISGRIFCFNCSNNWLQTPHSRYLSCHLILAVHRDPAIVVRLLQTMAFDKHLCELTQKNSAQTKEFWQVITGSKLQTTEAMILWPF